MKNQRFSFLAILLIVFLFLDLPSVEAQSWVDEDFFSALQYRNVGPTRGGRATAVAGVTSQVNTYYMGSTGGGVWKTTDFGNSWTNVSDGFFETSSIGAIRVYQKNPDIIYVGTGSDGIRSNVITGKGVYKSENAGKTWKHIGLKKTGQIGAVEIHPDDPNTVFVAAIGDAFAPNPDRGLYRTKDGGESWEKILEVSDSTGAVDFEFAPNNPKIMYAGMWRAERKPWTIISGSAVEGGLYKSADGGDSWRKLEGGLPNGLFGKTDLAVSPAAPSRVYALIEAPAGEGGLYVSNDYGENWTLVSTNTGILDRPFYYCNVDVDPRNSDLVYVNSTRFHKSTNGGKSWSTIRSPHGDNHDMWINPNNPENFIQCNDGGANITFDGGKTWSDQNNQATAELYQIEVDDAFPYNLYAGQQDNSTIMVPSIPPYNSPAGAMGYWMAVGGCETGPVVPKPGNPNIVYANCKGRFGVYDKTTGQEKQYYVGAANMYGHNTKELKYRFQRVSPIHVSSHNPDVVYHTSQYVHKTVDDGKTWETISPDLTANTPETQMISGSPITRDITGEEFYSTIYAIRESLLKEGVIWVGANDGPIHVTKNGGKKWENVTPSDLPSGGRVDCVEPSPHKVGKAYATILRYQLGDWKPYIYKTENYGQDWALLTNGKNGIPEDFPVRVVREDPDREGLLYAGTEFGMFVSFDDGKKWLSFQQNLPNTPITDIKVKEKDLVLSTMGRSFWILDNLTPLHQLKDEMSTGVTFFKPRDAYRMRYRGTSANSIPFYPAPSVMLDYHLASAPSGAMKLEIFDSKNKLIKTYESSKRERNQREEPSMAFGFFTQGFSSNLNSEEGLHRFRWDMRHEGAWNSNARRSGRGGPLVSPGTYSAKLSVDGKTYTQAFRIKMDPRVKKTGLSIADLQEQEALSLKVVDLQSKANRMSNTIQKELKTAEKDKNTGSKVKTLNEIKAELVTEEGRYMKPVLNAQLSYLYGMISRADQIPGKDAYDRFQELKAWYEQILPKFNASVKAQTP